MYLSGYAEVINMDADVMAIYISIYLYIYLSGYAEVINMDADVMAMLQKSISAKLCPTVIGQGSRFNNQHFQCFGSVSFEQIPIFFSV